MTKTEMLETLRKQDEMLKEIFAQREAIAQECRAKGNTFYDSVWEALYSDGESHYTF